MMIYWLQTVWWYIDYKLYDDILITNCMMIYWLRISLILLRSVLSFLLLLL